MDAARAGWMNQAEIALKGLRDVEGVVIQGQGDDIREIHIVTSSTRPAKQIVRDVQTLLLARFHRVIDHRVVSVAFTEVSSPAAPQTEPVAVASEPASAARPARSPAPAPESADHRIRFRSANLFVTGPRLQAQVDFQWKGLPRSGTATGHGTRETGHRLIAQAVLLGIQDFLEEDIALSLEGLEFSRVGARDVAVVNVQLVAHREHKNLVGCCTVEQDVPQAVALATLAAVNRVLGGLPTREPTEYVLRPTSL
jgi:hypothetical protein